MTPKLHVKVPITLNRTHLWTQTTTSPSPVKERNSPASCRSKERRHDGGRWLVFGPRSICTGSALNIWILSHVRTAHLFVCKFSHNPGLNVKSISSFCMTHEPQLMGHLHLTATTLEFSNSGIQHSLWVAQRSPNCGCC